jgi:hypothetical protein
MQLSLADIGSLAGPSEQAVWTAIVPFIPVLAREGEEVYTGFIEYLNQGNWVAIDQLLYKKMTPAERAVLEDQVYLNAVEAVQAHSDEVQLIKDVLLQILVKVAMAAATAAVTTA